MYKLHAVFDFPEASINSVEWFKDRLVITGVHVNV